MRILSARIFLSLLAGKLNTVKPMSTRKQLLNKKWQTGLENLFFTLTINVWQRIQHCTCTKWFKSNFWNRKNDRSVLVDRKIRMAVKRDEKDESQKLNWNKVNAKILHQHLSKLLETWQAFVTKLKLLLCTSLLLVYWQNVAFSR